MLTRTLILGVLLFLTLSSFSQATHKPSDFTLPSSFEYFKAHRNTKKNVILKWGSHSYYTLEFSIERSLNGVDYEQLNFVIDNWEGDFEYMDRNVPTGRIHYRLIAVLSDGSYEISEVEVVVVEYDDETKRG